MVVEPALDLSLVAGILSSRVFVNLLLLLLALEDQILDETHAPVGEVAVVLVGVCASDSPVLDGGVFAGL